MVRHPELLAIRPQGQAYRVHSNRDASNDPASPAVNYVYGVSRGIGDEYMLPIESHRPRMGAQEGRVTNHCRFGR